MMGSLHRVRAPIVVLAVLAASLVWATGAWAAAGDLDQSFSQNGWTATGFAGGNARALGVAVQPTDHKVISVGGATNEGTFDFAIVRYTKSGGYDANFGDGGKVLDSFSSGNVRDEFAYDVALLSDGRFVVVGAISTSSGDDFALARYKRNGSPDTTFGDQGHVITDLGGNDGAVAVGIQANGKIVVGGVSDDRMALARYGPGGTLDLSFGPNGTGFVTTAVGAGAVAWDMAFDQNERILLAGETMDGLGDSDFAVLRYSKTGRLDRGYGGDGRATADFGTDADHGHALAIVNASKAVVVGDASGDLALARFNGDGTLDAGFGTGGTTRQNVPAGNADAADLVVQSNGQLVTAGAVATGAGTDIVTARYGAGGLPDGSFGSGGVRVTDLGTSKDGATAAARDGGKIVVSGTIASGQQFRFLAARFLSS